MSDTVFPESKSSNGEEWISVSDLMAGLMMVFMAIAIFFMLQVKSEQAELENIAQIYEQLKLDLFKTLEMEFREDLPKWNATIYEETLSIRFREPDVLFDQGSSQLKGRFKTILDDFFPRYVAILSDEQFREHVKEIRIEGHTSSEWTVDTSSEAAYLLNMALSQERTRSVLGYVFQLPEVAGDKGWLRPRFTANGLSSSQPIAPSGIEDHEASRRVEFRVRTDSEEQMAKIQERMKVFGNDRGGE